MSDAPRAIVAGHGDYAVGLISAVDQITGRGGLLVPVSGAGRSATQIEEAIRETMQARGLRVIFTDLQAGSCTMAARRMTRGLEDAVVICGTNLPMLLDFVLAEGVSPEEAARHALERGRSAMAAMAGAPAPSAAPAAPPPEKERP